LWAKVLTQSSPVAIIGADNVNTVQAIAIETGGLNGGFLCRVILFRWFDGAFTFALATLEPLSYAATAFQRN
jgi:hypothetical protein